MAAHGCDMIADGDLDAPADFYASLARARPTLIDIDMGARTLANDACVQI